MTQKTVAILGLIVCFLYFATTVAFVATGSNPALLLFEIITMLSGVYMVFLIAALPYAQHEKSKIPRIAAVSCAAACMAITNIVHFLNITVIRPMIAGGVEVPDYLVLGLWPSAITATEYIAWGLFIALAFLLLALISKPKTILKPLLCLCGCLCMVGFLGVMINEYLWYVAPLGYGVGTVVICIALLRQGSAHQEVLPQP